MKYNVFVFSLFLDDSWFGGWLSTWDRSFSMTSELNLSHRTSLIRFFTYSVHHKGREKKKIDFQHLTKIPSFYFSFSISPCYETVYKWNGIRNLYSGSELVIIDRCWFVQVSLFYYRCNQYVA